MTRVEAKEILRHWDDVVWRSQNHITMGDAFDALLLAEEALSNPWHKASENDRRAREDYQLCRDSHFAGAEHGYKKAIEVAKEWLKEHSHIGARMIGSVHCTSLMTQGELLADFEADMNKLWEGEK